MVFDLSSPNWIDLAILLALCVGVVVGIGQGLLRQIMAIFALYVSTTLSLQYYRLVAGGLSEVMPELTPESRNGLALAAVFLLALLVLNWLSYGIYPSTRLGSLEWLDRAAGAILAGGWVACLFGVGLVITGYSLSGMYAAWEPPRQVFDRLLSQSVLSEPLLAALPPLLRVIAPWLPYGLPAPFVF